MVKDFYPRVAASIISGTSTKVVWQMMQNTNAGTNQVEERIPPVKYIP